MMIPKPNYGFLSNFIVMRWHGCRVCNRSAVGYMVVASVVPT